MRVADCKPALVSVCSALLASLCCLLPLAVMILGLGSGAFMALTMRYQAILLPLGILGVAAGYVLYVRERRRCHSLACAMAGSRLNLVALLIATLVLVGELVLVVFPGAASTLFTRAVVGVADRPERFAAQGSIVAVEHEKPMVTIAHGDIPGLWWISPKMSLLARPSCSSMCARHDLSELTAPGAAGPGRAAGCEARRGQLGEAAGDCTVRYRES